MPLPYVPIYFRGLPTDEVQAGILDGLLVLPELILFNGPFKGLSNRVKSQKNYLPTMTDEEVWRLYSKSMIQSIKSTFARPLVVIPCPVARIGNLEEKRGNVVEQTVQFLGQRFAGMNHDMRNGKQIIFLEHEGDKRRLESILGLKTTLGKRWMIEGNYGWIFVLPLYLGACDQVWSLRGKLREFLEKPNDELARIYRSVSDGSSPISSPRPQTR